jgi:hypothetical protein
LPRSILNSYRRLFSLRINHVYPLFCAIPVSPGIATNNRHRHMDARSSNTAFALIPGASFDQLGNCRTTLKHYRAMIPPSRTRLAVRVFKVISESKSGNFQRDSLFFL